MQRFVTCRALAAAAALIVGLAACHPAMNNPAGQKPPPGSIQARENNSTAAPEHAMSNTPSDAYFARVSPATRGVVFSVWANGRPITNMVTPGQSVNIAPEMRGHANDVAVQWQRRSKHGTGALTISGAGKTILTVNVTPHTPDKGQQSKVFIAPQYPASAGNGS